MSSIPATYTDLVVVATIIGSTAGADIRVQVNGDTGTNYSITRLIGYTTATSNRASSAAYMNLTNSVGVSTADATPDIYNFMNYSNTTTNKTVLFRHNQFQSGLAETYAEVGLWRSTAAINSITFSLSSGNFATSSVFTLYGIKAA
jgi:hypothetical protein